MFCCTLLYVHSSFAILIGKREQVALLGLSFWCLVIVKWLFLVMPWVCLQFLIMVVPDNAHYFNRSISFRYPLGIPIQELDELSCTSIKILLQFIRCIRLLDVL